MDLDEIELKATRKLLGLDKKENKQQNYDDNDYLIAREECVEYNNDNNINISSIEEAIKIVKSLIENTKESLISNTKLSQNRKTNRIIAYKATEYLLSEYKRQKQINKELKQKINDLDIDLTTVNIREFKENNSKIKNDYKKENLELREKVKKFEEEKKNRVNFQQKYIEVTNLYLNSIPKQKIKDKIEGIDKRIDYIKTELTKLYIEKETIGTETEIDNNEYYIYNLEKEEELRNSQKNILQELLQEEDK